MRNGIPKIFLPIILLALSIEVSAMSFPQKWSYMSVDSISEKIALSPIILDLKNDSLVLNLNNKQFHFYPEYTIDSITPFYLNHYLKAELDVYVDVRLYVQNLLSFDDDFIYVSARYAYWNNQSDLNNSFYTIDSLAISKKDIKGFMYQSMDFSGKSLSFLYLGYIGNVKNKDSEKERNHSRKYIVSLRKPSLLFCAMGHPKKLLTPLSHRLV